MEKNTALLSLKEEIKKHTVESREINKAIQQESGLARHCLRQSKAALGYHSRYLLLAYAILRGRPYEQQERNGCFPYITLLVDKANEFGGNFDRESVEAWCERPQTEEKAA